VAKRSKAAKLAKNPEPASAEESHHERVASQEFEELRLSAAETRALMTICVELLDFCTRVSGKIDPTAALMVTWARDEVTIPIFGFRA
jgi:hypothetical protein